MRAGQFLASLSGDGPLRTDDDAVEYAAAGIGQAAAAQLFATIRLESELPKIETILANPGSAKIPGAPDAQMLTASLRDATIPLSCPPGHEWPGYPQSSLRDGLITTIRL